MHALVQSENSFCHKVSKVTQMFLFSENSFCHKVSKVTQMFLFCCFSAGKKEKQQSYRLLPTTTELARAQHHHEEHEYTNTISNLFRSELRSASSVQSRTPTNIYNRNQWGAWDGWGGGGGRACVCVEGGGGS